MGSYLDSTENLQAYQQAMNDLNPRWQDLYEAALLELNPDKLLQCIERAEQAIREQTIARSEHNPQELEAMQDALHALSLLRRSALRG